MMLDRADMLWEDYRAQLDLSSPLDGIPDVLLCGTVVILLPAGTSP